MYIKNIFDRNFDQEAYLFFIFKISNVKNWVKIQAEAWGSIVYYCVEYIFFLVVELTYYVVIWTFIIFLAFSCIKLLLKTEYITHISDALHTLLINITFQINANLFDWKSCGGLLKQ